MSKKIRMTAVTHPFKASRKLLEFAPGKTVADMLLVAQPERAKLRNAIVFINGNVIPRQIWNTHQPLEGELVEVRAFPVPRGGGGGGGKNILNIILMIAVVAVAVWAAPLAAALIGFTAGTLAFGVATAFIGAGYVGLGMLAVNALCPVSSGKAGSQSALSSSDTTDSNTLFIEGSSNSLDPFGVVPVILGKHRQTPRQGSKPYTEMIGDEQYLRMLFIWGIGPISIDLSTLKIGDTLLSAFSDYQIEHREGYSADAALTLFPEAISEEGFTVTLTQVADWISRTTAVNSDEISVDISFQSGLTEFDGSGNKQARTVNVEIEYRKVGEAGWTKIDTAGAKFKATCDASWLNTTGGLLDSINFTAKKTSGLKYGIRWGVSERAQYDVRVRRTTLDTDSSMISDATYWTALRSIKAEGPVNSPVPLAMTALVIKATDQLNGIIDDFSGVVTRVCDDWSAGSPEGWVERVSQNPASAFRFVLQGNGMADPMADTRIDLDALQDWHEFCEAKGYKFNQVRDYSSSIWETLRDICAAGRAAPTIIDGKWSVVIDREQTAPVSVITPRNSFDFSAEKFFLNPPHGWRIQFTNEDEGYKTDEYRVYQDGYTDENATKFESLSLIGVTDPDQIFKLGRWRIAQVLNQPERWTFKQDIEFLTYQRGDWVKIAHDVMIVGIASGRVKSIVTNESNAVVSITLDEEVIMEAGKTYGVVVRTLTDPSLSAQVITAEGTTNTLVFSSEVSGIGSPAEPAISVGDIVCFGEFGEETEDATVISITPDNNLQATIVAIPYRPAIYDCDTEEIPEFVTRISPDAVIPAPNITSIVSDATAIVIASTGSYKIRVGVNFDPLNTYIFGESSVEVQMRQNGTGENYYPAVIEEQGRGYVFIGDVRGGDVIDIRIRFKVGDRLIPGPWATDLSYAVIGKDAPPSDVTGFLVKQSRDRLTCVWNEVDDFDFYCYEIRQGTSWESGVILGTGITQNSFISLFITSGVAQNFWIKVIDTSGNYSATATQAILTVDNVPFTNIIVSYAEETAWAGTKTDLVKSGNNLALDTGQLQGTYLTPIRDVGYVATFKIGINGICVVSGDSTWQDFGEQTFNEQDDSVRFLGIEQAGALTYEINYSVDNIVWSGWQPWIPADYKCRYFQLRMTMARASASIALLCSIFDYFADLPDIDEMQDLTISIAATGVTVTFAKTFHQNPAVNVTILSGTGVYHTVTSLTTTGVVIKLYDVSGTAQTGNIRIHVHGI